MSLYRAKTYAGGYLYAQRIPEIPGAVKFVPAKHSASLLSREEAAAIKKRLSGKPLRMKIKLEVA